MDWFSDEEEQSFKIQSSYNCPKIFNLMAGKFLFSYSPWTDSHCSVWCFSPPVSSMWNVTLELVAKFKKTDNLPEISKCHVFTLCYQDQKKEIKLWPIGDLKPYCCDKGHLSVDISIRVLGSNGLRRLRSESSIERFQRSLDGYLVVDGKKISVNKATLSFESPFFDALFNSDFKEKENGIFELKDVKYDEIVCLMRVLFEFQSVNGVNYLSILELSHRYQIDRLTAMAEDYIIGNVELNCVDERLKFLKLSDKYTLCRVQTKVIHSIKDMKEVKILSMKPEFKKLCATSRAFILNYFVARF